MDRIGCLVLFISFGCLWSGGQGLYIGLTNPTPRVMTCGEYERENISAKWIKLKECKIDLTQALATFNKGQNTFRESGDFYVPLRPSGKTAGGPIKVILKVKDPIKQGILKSHFRLQPLPEKQEAFVKENYKSMIRVETVQGLVIFGIDSRQSLRDKLKKGVENLSENFIILDETASPNTGLSALLAALGLALLLGSSFFFWRGKEKEKPADEKKTEKKNRK